MHFRLSEVPHIFLLSNLTSNPFSFHGLLALWKPFEILYGLNHER